MYGDLRHLTVHYSKIGKKELSQILKKDAWLPAQATIKQTASARERRAEQRCEHDQRKAPQRPDAANVTNCVAGSCVGTRIQSHVPEASLRKLLGLVACLVAARYTQLAVQHPRSPSHSHTSP
jgi:hypothetical protein